MLAGCSALLVSCNDNVVNTCPRSISSGHGACIYIGLARRLVSKLRCPYHTCDATAGAAFINEDHNGSRRKCKFAPGLYNNTKIINNELL